jgi:hypothetical protein
MQLVGSTEGGWVYTESGLGVQNENSSVYVTREKEVTRVGPGEKETGHEP